ncbi:hypothetical protein [Arthrobacter sp. HLT1-21]
MWRKSRGLIFGKSGSDFMRLVTAASKCYRLKFAPRKTDAFEGSEDQVFPLLVLAAFRQDLAEELRERY